MLLSVVLVIVLGAALIGCLAALFVTERRGAAARRRPPVPSAVAGEEALEAVDAGLRRLVTSCQAASLPLPDVYAVTWSGQRLTLRLADTNQLAPMPWLALEEGTAWTVEPVGPAEGLTRPDPGLPPQPYPLTVTLGLAGGERVLVNLARAYSAVSLIGGDEDVRDLVRAIVAEVLTAPLGQTAEVTLVGSAAAVGVPDALSLRSARLHTAATLGEAMAPAVSPSPQRSPLPVTQVYEWIDGSPGQYRAQGRSPRLYVVEADQFRQERQAASTLGESDALLVLGDATGTGWRFRVAPDGSLDGGALGVRITIHAGRMR
ncbi:hypothetical protein ACTWP5_26500 [Streptomyces sp. 4N509B]|uniref:hypothetical protein n=1 Tax=Streptomyces sp. 4N509B TaxID=3457413 RepID=UPI003FD42C13